MNHCFEYLRQSILCAGNTSLEKAIVVDGEIRCDVDGWGVQHQCREYDAIYALVEKNHATDETGID